MSDSQQAAEVAALRALGWHLPATPAGAVVTGVVAPSPARRAGIKVADRVVSVNGASVTSACAMVSALHDVAPGTKVRLGVEPAHISSTGVITWASARTVSLTTAATPQGLGAGSCPGPTGRERSWLGVSLEDGQHYQLPATISINTANIGGPSAGLAMTLTLI